VTDYIDSYNSEQSWNGTTSVSSGDGSQALGAYFDNLKTLPVKPMIDTHRIAQIQGPPAYNPFAPRGRAGLASVPYQPAGPPERYSVNLLGESISTAAESALGKGFLGTPGGQRGGSMTVDFGPMQGQLATAPVNFQNFATYAREGVPALLTSALGMNYQQPLGEDPYAKPPGPVNDENLLTNLSQGDFRNVIDNVIDGIATVGTAIGDVAAVPVNWYREENAIVRGRGLRSIFATGSAWGGSDWIGQVTSLLTGGAYRYDWSGIVKQAEMQGANPIVLAAELWDVSPEVAAQIQANPTMSDEQLQGIVRKEPFSYDPGVNVAVELVANIAPILVGAGLVRGVGLGGRMVGMALKPAEMLASTSTAGRVGAGVIDTYEGLRAAGAIGRPVLAAAKVGSWSGTQFWRAAKVAEAANRWTLISGSTVRAAEWGLKQAFVTAGWDEGIKAMDSLLWQMPLSTNPGLMLLDAFAVHPMRTGKAIIGAGVDKVGYRTFGGGDLSVTPVMAERLGTLIDMPMDTIQTRLLDPLGWDAASVARLFGEDATTKMTKGDLLNGMLYVAAQAVRKRHEKRLRFMEPTADTISRNEAFWATYGEEAVHLLQSAVTGRGKDAGAIVSAFKEEFWKRAGLIDAAEYGDEGLIGPYDPVISLYQFTSWNRVSKMIRGFDDANEVVKLRADVNTQFTRAYRDRLATMQPGDVVPATMLNELRIGVPSIVKYERGILKRAGNRVPKLTVRQVNRILDAAEAEQAVTDLRHARPRTEGIPALRPEEVVAGAEQTNAIARAFVLHEATVKKLLTVKSVDELLGEPVPSDVAAIAAKLWRMSPDEMKRRPDVVWKHVFDWWSQSYPDAIQRGEAISAVERFARIVADRYAGSGVNEGGLDAEAFRRINENITHPYRPEERTGALGNAIADERDAARDTWIDTMSRWLDAPERPLHVLTAPDGVTQLIEVPGFSRADAGLIERLAVRAQGLDLSAEATAILADPLAHPLEKVVPLREAITEHAAQFEVSATEAQRLADMPDLSVYDSLVKEVLGDDAAVATRDTVAQVTGRAVASAEEIDALREQARSLAEIIDMSPTAHLSGEMAEFLDRAANLGGKPEAPNWRGVPLTSTGLRAATNEATLANALVGIDARLTRATESLAKVDAELSRVSTMGDSGFKPADVTWSEAPLTKFTTKKEAVAFAKERSIADGTIYGVSKVGSRWGMFKGEYTPRERTPAEVLAATTRDTVIAPEDVAASQQANVDVGVAAGGTPESGGAVKPTTTRATYEQMRQMAHDRLDPVISTTELEMARIRQAEAGMSESDIALVKSYERTIKAARAELAELEKRWAGEGEVPPPAGRQPASGSHDGYFVPQDWEALAEGVAPDAPRLQRGYAWQQVPIERLDRLPDIQLAELYRAARGLSEMADDATAEFASKPRVVKRPATPEQTYDAHRPDGELGVVPAKEAYWTFSRGDGMNYADQSSGAGPEHGKFATAESAKAAMQRFIEAQHTDRREQIAMGKHDLPFLEAEVLRRPDLPINASGEVIQYAGSLQDASNGFVRAKWEAMQADDSTLAMLEGMARGERLKAVYTAEMVRRAGGGQPEPPAPPIPPVVERITEAQKIREAQVESMARDVAANEQALTDATAEYQAARVLPAQGAVELVAAPTGPISATEISAFEETLAKSATMAEGEATRFRGAAEKQALAKLEKQRGLTREDASTDLTPEEALTDLNDLGPKPKNAVAKAEWQQDYDRLSRIVKLDRDIADARTRLGERQSDAKAAEWYSRYTVVEGIRHAIKTARWDAQLVAAVARMEPAALSKVVDRVIAEHPNGVTIGAVPTWFNAHFDEFVPRQDAVGAMAKADAAATEAAQVGLQVKRDREVTFNDPQDNKTLIRARVVLVDADGLLTSDRPGFPPNLQPRSRGVRASSDEQILSYAQDIQPGKLFGTTEGSTGMPVVLETGAVLAGNGRTLALRLANEAQYAKYREALVKELAKHDYGYTEADVATMKRPMLVREIVEAAGTDVERLAWQLNEMPVGDLAPSIAASLTRSDIREFKVGDEQSLADAIRAPSNTPAVAKMIGRLPRDWHARYFDPQTGLNEPGAKLLEAALLSKVLRADDRAAPGFQAARSVVFQVAEQGGEDIRRISGGLAEGAAQMVKAYELADSGAIGPDILTFGDDIAPALARIIELRGSGLNMEGVTRALDNVTAFDEFTLTPTQTTLAKLLAASTTQKEVRTFMRAVAKAAEDGPVAGQEALFGDIAQVDYIGLLNEGVRAWNEPRKAARAKLVADNVPATDERWAKLPPEADYFASLEAPYDVPLGTAISEDVFGATQGPARMSQPLAVDEVAPEIAARVEGEQVTFIPDTVEGAASAPDGALILPSDPMEGMLYAALRSDWDGVMREYADLYDTLDSSSDPKFRQDAFAELLASANRGDIRPAEWMALRTMSGLIHSGGGIRKNKAGKYNMKLVGPMVAPDVAAMGLQHVRAAKDVITPTQRVRDLTPEEFAYYQEQARKYGDRLSPERVAEIRETMDPKYLIAEGTTRQMYVDAIAAVQRGETPIDPDTGQPLVALTKEHALKSLRSRMNALGPEAPAQVIHPDTQQPLSAAELVDDVGPAVPHDVPSAAIDEAIASTEHTVVVGDNPTVNRAIRTAVGAPAVEDGQRRVFEIHAPGPKVMAERLAAKQQEWLAAIDAAKRDRAEAQAAAEAVGTPAEPTTASVFPDPETRALWDKLMRGPGTATDQLNYEAVEPYSMGQIADAVLSIDRGVIVDPQTGLGLTSAEATALRTHLMRVLNGELSAAEARQGGARRSAFMRSVNRPPDPFDAEALQDRVRVIEDQLSQVVKVDPDLPVLEGFLGVQYVLSAAPKLSKVDRTRLSPRLLLRDVFTDPHAAEVIPTLDAELEVGRMETVPRRVGNARIVNLIGHIFGPRSEKEIRARAAENLHGEVESFLNQDVTDAAELEKVQRVVAGAIEEWRTYAEEEKFVGFQRYRRISLLGPEKINKLFDDAVKKEYPSYDPESKTGRPAWLADIYAANSSPFKLLRRADNRMRNYIAESGLPLSSRVERVYGKVADIGEAPGRNVTIVYHFARFLMDIRWLGLEAVEPMLIAVPRGGVGSVLEASLLRKSGKVQAAGRRMGIVRSGEPLLFGLEDQRRQIRDFAHWAAAGDTEQGQGVRWRYLVSELSREQPRPFRDIIKTMMREEPGLKRIIDESDGGNVDAFLSRLDRDWQLTERGTRKFDTTAEAAQFFDRWRKDGVIDDLTYNEFVDAKQYSASPQIEAELAKTMGDPVTEAVFQRLAAVNQSLFHDLTSAFFGQDNRSNIQRAVNHPFLFWPISYQIKATKWLLKIMLDEAGGVDTGAAVGGAFQKVYDEHRRRWVSEPGYRARFEQNRNLYFLAGMLFPIIPTELGVSLSPFTRLALNSAYQRPMGIMGWGPIYTNLSLIPRIIAEQSKPGQPLGDPAYAPVVDKLKQFFPQSITIGAPSAKNTSQLAAENAAVVPKGVVPIPYLPPTDRANP